MPAVLQFVATAVNVIACLAYQLVTKHQRRSKPREYGIDIACPGGVVPYEDEYVPVLDGVNHPSNQH